VRGRSSLGTRPASALALDVRGAVARLRRSPLAARSSHANRSPQPFPSRRVRRSSRPPLSPLPAVAFVASLLTPTVRSFLPALRRGVVGAAPCQRLRRIVFQGCPPSPPLLPSMRWLSMGESTRHAMTRGNTRQPIFFRRGSGSFCGDPGRGLFACAFQDLRAGPD